MASDVPLAPDFIRFLFSTKPKFDSYFLVKDSCQGKPVRIGAVKLMLMAHSEVFRLQLEESDLAEKGVIPVEDIHPYTFKGMLKYIYGHDTTPDMSFDDADDMLYAAEKYMIKTLKDKLAVRLMKLLNPGNICSLLNNPACYTHLQLNSAITEILRYETDSVLASPHFLWMNTEGFLKILEQDGLSVPEIELWRAAIKWAKHRANSEDGQQLRQQVSGLTRHLRLCTLTESEVFDVLSSSPDVLSAKEIGAICVSIKKKEKPKGLREISNEIVPRKRLNVNMKQHTQQAYGPSVQKQCELQVKYTGQTWGNTVCNYSFTISTKEHAIELLPLVCQARNLNAMTECKTTITKVENPFVVPMAFRLGVPNQFGVPNPFWVPNQFGVPNPYYRGSSSPIAMFFSERVMREEFEIPLAVDGRNITLLPDTEYTVEMELKGDHCRWHNNNVGIHANDHLTLEIYENNNFRQVYGHLPPLIIPHTPYYRCPFTKLQYRVTTVD